MKRCAVSGSLTVEAGVAYYSYPGSATDESYIEFYVAPSYAAHADARHDLDTASYALVRTWPNGRTGPKGAYRAVAERYGAQLSR